MINTILKRIRHAFIKQAIRIVEKSGLSVVQIKRGNGAVYLIARNGQYVRFDKVK